MTKRKTANPKLVRRNPEGSPKLSDSEKKESWVRHPLIIAIISALIVSVTGVAVFRYEHPSPHPYIEVDDVQVKNPNSPYTPLKIIVSIRNTGDQRAVIKAVDLKITQSEKLPICLAQGGLPLTGKYKNNLPTENATGKVVRVSASQQVAPDHADKFEILLKVPHQKTPTVFIYAANVSVISDTGTASANEGRVTLILPIKPNFQFFWTHLDQRKRLSQYEFSGYGFPQESSCLIRNSEALHSFMQSSGSQVRELSRWIPRLAYCCVVPYPKVSITACSTTSVPVRPVSVSLTCDGSIVLSGLKWSRWSFKEAIGSGVYRQVGCVNPCQSGSSRDYPVEVRFSNPVIAYFGKTALRYLWFYNRYSLTFPDGGPGGKELVVNSDFGPDPSRGAPASSAARSLGG